MNGTTNCIICKTPVDVHQGISVTEGITHVQPCHQMYLEQKAKHRKKLTESTNKQPSLIESITPIMIMCD